MNKTKVLVVGVLVAGILVAGVVANWTNQTTKAYNPDNFIRFHIIPNSDDELDQALKYRVRDAVVKSVSPLVGEIDDAGEAARVIQANLDMIKDVGEEEVARAGKNYPVDVRYGTYRFPTRTYNDLTLPAGEYQAVRVIIGSGTGANWWCVLFPPLCFVSTEIEPGPPDDSGAPLMILSSRGSDRFEVKFKLAELWERSSELAVQLAEHWVTGNKEKRF